MSSLADPSRVADNTLWCSVCRDDRSAFEELVRRHQTAVAAVAYSACGDLTLSEDIAQETFWAAWRERAALLDPGRVRSWLCGIARNLAKNALRRTRRAESLDDQADPVSAASEPADEAASREELELVWQTLEEIPEQYREPLVLYYREQQSVAEVAESLDLSSDAVKQRLSRGREYLREQIAGLVERTLSGSRPHASFTAGVMAGLAAISVGSKGAIAATTATVGAGATSLKGTSVVGTMASAGTAGVVGGVIGTVAGLIGGWLGAWLPAQLAPTNRERDYLMRVARRLLIVSVAATGVLIALVLGSITWKPPAWVTAGGVVGWILVFQLYVGMECFITARAVRSIRAATPPDSDRNTAPMAVAARSYSSQWEGRRYRSSATLLGLPLVDIQVSDPGASMTGSTGLPPRGKARGWIAIGDRADGVLLAIGGDARGFIAFGGRAIGVISMGGLAFGVFAFGGLALGAVAFGGLGIGAIAFGGGAIGWQACGGGAIAWDVAAGGGAVAHHAAFGGGALAHDIAVGGGAIAAHANDEVAKTFFEGHWMVELLQWMQTHNTIFIVTTIFASLVPSLLCGRFMYRRKPMVMDQD